MQLERCCVFVLVIQMQLQLHFANALTIFSVCSFVCDFLLLVSCGVKWPRYIGAPCTRNIALNSLYKFDFKSHTNNRHTHTDTKRETLETNRETKIERILKVEIERKGNRLM